jgi:hypothetical protein
LPLPKTSAQEDRVLLRQDLDEIYTAFCETVPRHLRPIAQQLPYHLRMAAAPGVPWSEVFGHEVTFAAPALFAQAMPQISAAKVRDAVLAHGFAVIDAFGTDRVEDRQIETSSELEDVLGRIREASDRALLRVVGSLGDDATDLSRARRAMLDAISVERRIMVDGDAVDFDFYERTALAKAGIGSPASVALARAAGWSPAECRAVARTLDSVWLGMQCHDDVIDWEDDFKRDSAWAQHLIDRESDAPANWHVLGRDVLRSNILESGILAKMLHRSARHFRAARKRAEALGARELAAWAGTKEAHSQSLAQFERNNSGYAVRLHALSPWIAQVLS